MDNGVSVFLCNVEDDPRLGQLHVDAMLEKRVDGILATGKRLDRHLPIDLSRPRRSRHLRLHRTGSEFDRLRV